MMLWGQAPDPFAAWLLERGLKTLELRVLRQNDNALRIARWCEDRKEIRKVMYPGLASHPDHALAREVLDGFGGMMALELAGGGAALAFAMALMASGFASSSVGTYAGQVVMQGFINRRIPLALRRLVTMFPALIVLAVGLDPSRSLVISQVVLSFGIPFALIPLVLLTRRRDIMGALVNRRITTIVASIVAAMISLLNVFLLAQTFGIA